MAVVAALTIGLLLVIAVAVTAHVHRSETKLRVLRSLAGQRVKLGYSTGGSYRLHVTIDARIDEVAAGFPARCSVTPYAVVSAEGTWQPSSSERRIALDEPILVDRIVWLETPDGVRYEF